MESAVPRSQGNSGADPERDGAGVAQERDEARGLERVATESNGAAGALPQIQEATGEGKTCHQCRQKRTHYAAACTAVKNYGLCSLRYCRSCLRNRYGEVAEVVAQKANWTCPKCRGDCNCSMCRKKNGETPTGILAPAAKASGCSSVHDLLNKGADMVAAAQKLVNPLKGKPSITLGTENGANEVQAGADDLNAVPSVPAKKNLKVNCKVNKCPADKKSLLGTGSLVAPENAIALPRGTPVTNIAGVELEAEDVGPAIQFYEFCRSFAEFFQIRKGQPERILQDITGGRELRVVASLIAELHINLFSIIKEDRGEKPLNYSRDGDGWIIDIGKYITESDSVSKEFPLDSLKLGLVGYKNLSPSCKLYVLNFLCDATLSSVKFRTWTDEQNEKAAERKNAAREKIRAANEKEKELKERQSDMAKDPLLSEGADTPSNVESEIKEAKEVKQTATNALDEEVGVVLSTKPVMVDKGVAYWKLDGYCNDATIMRQEIDSQNIISNKDIWFKFTEDEEKVIGDHVARRSRGRSRKRTWGQ